MIVTLSSKGQLVIPRAIRHALQLKPGTQFTVELNQDQIVLKPVTVLEQYQASIDRLYGKFRQGGLRKELEDERQRERQRDEARGL